MSVHLPRERTVKDRRHFIGGSDARIIMGDDEGALVRLWREKRGEVEPEDLSGNLIVQLGLATEDLNRRWYEANTGQVITDIQQRVFHPALEVDGGDFGWPGVGERCGVRSPNSCCHGRSRRRGQQRNTCPQLQHNMWVVAARTAVLSVITGGGKWVEILAHADPLYQHLIVTAERKFWRCVENGEEPKLFGVEPPKPRIEAVRIVDMSSSNAWAEFAGIFARTRSAHLEHEQAKTELKGLMPEDAKEAIGHGVRAKRSKSGAVSFDLLKQQQRRGGRPCSGPVTPSPPWRPLWPRPRSSSPIRRSRWSAPSNRQPGEGGAAAVPLCPAVERA